MQCPVQSGNPDVLLDYIARRLSVESMDVFTRHMEQCPDCARFAQAQQEIWFALDCWETQPVSPDFDAKLYARIDAETRRNFWSRIFGDAFAWRPAAMASAFAATALAVVLLVRGMNPMAPVAPVPQQMQQHDVVNKAEVGLEPEQVERALEDIEMLRQLNTQTL